MGVPRLTGETDDGEVGWLDGHGVGDSKTLWHHAETWLELGAIARELTVVVWENIWTPYVEWDGFGLISPPGATWVAAKALAVTNEFENTLGFSYLGEVLSLGQKYDPDGGGTRFGASYIRKDLSAGDLASWQSAYASAFNTEGKLFAKAAILPYTTPNGNRFADMNTGWVLGWNEVTLDANGEFALSGGPGPYEWPLESELDTTNPYPFYIGFAGTAGLSIITFDFGD